MSQLTQVFYYIPEDLDDPKSLNCFIIHQGIESLKVADIRREFPVPGTYLFRFQFMYQRNIVWLDLTNETCKLPHVNGTITIKAHRLKWKETQDYFAND